jgi:hypothetical protein
VIGNFNYFFFAAHLLDVAISFKTLRTILMSVTHNGKQVNLFSPRAGYMKQTELPPSGFKPGPSVSKSNALPLS